MMSIFQFYCPLQDNTDFAWSEKSEDNPLEVWNLASKLRCVGKGRVKVRQIGIIS